MNPYVIAGVIGLWLVALLVLARLQWEDGRAKGREEQARAHRARRSPEREDAA